MKHYVKIIQPKKEIEVHNKTTCDLCGEEAVVGKCDHGYNIGVNCPDGGHGTESVVDICQTCFVEKLLPWLESQWYKTEKKDWDW